jgi:hypothetical protein
MANFRHYGETPKNFPYLQELTEIFTQMTANEQGFTNQVRHLYYTAWNSSAKVSASDETGSHVFYGGHVVVMDAGAHYAGWAAQLQARELKGGERWSSHYKGLASKQYEVILPKLGCILFGKTANQHTWFQNESWQATESGLAGFGKWVAHGVLGYGAHKLSGGMQVGALGYSNWSEKNHSELVVPPNAVQV